MATKRARRQTVAERRARWAAEAKAEMEARKHDPEARLRWLQRRGSKARMVPVTWAAKVAEYEAALAPQAAAKRHEDHGTREAAKAASKARGKARGHGKAARR